MECSHRILIGCLPFGSCPHSFICCQHFIIIFFFRSTGLWISHFDAHANNDRSTKVCLSVSFSISNGCCSALPRARPRTEANCYYCLCHSSANSYCFVHSFVSLSTSNVTHSLFAAANDSSTTQQHIAWHVATTSFAHIASLSQYRQSRTCNTRSAK